MALTLFQSISLKMDKESPGWVIDAVPPALSNSAFNAKKYTTLTYIHDYFYKETQTAASINQTIKNILNFKKEEIGEQYKVLGSDDKGIVDFVQISFSLFGHKIQSPIYLYF